MKALSRGAIIDIIAPSGKVELPVEIEAITQQLNHWGYQARFGKHLVSDHPFLANTTELRFEDLKNALLAKDSEAIWCYKGGSGTAELLPLLAELSPVPEKLFLGFSDITSLHTFFIQQWGWKTFHGPCARQTAVNEIDEASQHAVKNLFEGKFTPINDCLPLNPRASISKTLTGEIIGGNLCIVAHACGTPYQIKTDGKILLLEDWNDPAYKIRRMLTQISQSGLLNKLKGLIFGDFSVNDPHQKKWIEDEIKVFAEKQSFPVYRTRSIGHDKKNIVVPLGKEVSFQFSKTALSMSALS